MANRGLKYRIHPTEEQEQQIVKTIGCARLVYNLALDMRMELYGRNKLTLGKYDCEHVICNVLKPRYPFLKEADKFALESAMDTLDEAYKHFFKGLGGFPNHKSKRRSRWSYTTKLKGKDGHNIEVRDNGIKLPKLGEVKAVIHRKTPDNWRIKQATVSKDRDGSYWCSVLYEYDDVVKPVGKLEATYNAIGLDYKTSCLYVDSNNGRPEPNRSYRENLLRLTRQQKALSRKKGSRKGEQPSRSFLKQQVKVAKLSRHIANQRKDYLHKLSNTIAKDYDLVCIEDLSVRKDLLLSKREEPCRRKRNNINRAVLDNGWQAFTTMLEYKLKDQGKYLIRVGHDFPSTQMCSVCGHMEPATKALGVRRWICPVCNTKHDRDHNAAVNIKEEGIRLLLAS